MRVLVVDDEEYLAEAVGAALTRAGMRVSLAFDGAEALSLIDASSPDVVVLDRDLPEVHGDEVCKAIVDTHPATRVIMLTASGTLDARLEGFSLGADDYLPKPFELPELIARVEALARRNAPERGEVYRCGDVRLDTFKRTVTRGDAVIPLSPKEFAVLEVLMAAGGGVISAEELLEEAWDANADPFTNSPRVTVSHLRRKLGDPWIVHTVTGAGYYVAEEER
ncbi:response regulator transcription factor [Corynebacterium sp. CNCTC7651]|uniref:response regulator transcription factor n=1 Tax=Corynebacterium sp. CNCTC7651 TaxID=2815361 RepID=UPI001F1F7258|nr:response regulator transcription factor [Corynebacterium sp. CNCTC7651]UIZ93312.1 response regulator transcription factor [Corynebacterium sp. CNCTC7651]